MSTGIEWTDETWNPVTGCTKVSPGCDNCYAERITNRFGGPGAFDTVVLHPDRLDAPRHWRKPRRVFVNSMSDLFHDDVPDEFIARVFAVMAACQEHTFQILTKRPGRMASWVRRVQQCEHGWWTHDGSNPLGAYDGTGIIVAGKEGWPLPNVWLGTSVEDQRWADVRIPKLLETPAAVRFLSCEPLLGPVSFRWARWQPLSREPGGRTDHLDGLRRLDWVIVGGESGPGARPMHPDWARSIRDQCVAAGVPFFFKQWGEWAEGSEGDLRRTDAVARDGRHWPWIGLGAVVDADVQRDPGPHGLSLMSRLGKKRAGRELDGRTWDEYPVAMAYCGPRSAKEPA